MSSALLKGLNNAPSVVALAGSTLMPMDGLEAPWRVFPSNSTHSPAVHGLDLVHLFNKRRRYACFPLPIHLHATLGAVDYSLSRPLSRMLSPKTEAAPRASPQWPGV